MPVGQYTDEAIARQELRLLRRHPQPVAASASLAAPGAWLSLTYVGVPLLLVRQEKGQVQAFRNVCRHRGARVVPEGSGSGASWPVLVVAVTAGSSRSFSQARISGSFKLPSSALPLEFQRQAGGMMRVC
ncbi:rieske (2Fe-2S) domain-containing protein [Variovorax paradoxus B4]|uniref:Rieske (2Fe-2S) domain-containing protein n=1 Tax=Variovorax paradoxus B4 TaxID=1246301 RepID=T1X9J6_VARPD|nr:Rieske 2Fe-2S domain-containing protein [Variovorax paradoxus]AGU49141.1 rieske (2Fe-2S) domain-containing protein [Variovorax paradoxus B4]